MTLPHTLHIAVLLQLRDILELCTHPILVQNEQIELTRIYLYPFIADVSRNTNYGHNHYLSPFFKSLIQALHAYRAKGKAGKSKMAEHSCSTAPTLLMCLLFLMYICATMCHNMAQNMAHFTNVYLCHNVP